MNARPCPEFHASVTLLAADALAPAEREATERHLRHCPFCQRHLASLRQWTVPLAAAAIPAEGGADAPDAPGQLPAGFHGRLQHRLRTESKRREASGLRRWVSGWPAALTLPRLVLGAAAAAVLITLFLRFQAPPAPAPRLAHSPAPPSPPSPAPAALPGATPSAFSAEAPTLRALNEAWRSSERGLDSFLDRQSGQVAALDAPLTLSGRPAQF